MIGHCVNLHAFCSTEWSLCPQSDVYSLLGQRLRVNEIIKKDPNTTQWFKINKVR